MRGFILNNCRLCNKVFCCKKCRIKHEANIHKVVPECDICVYGRLILSENFDVNVLQHLKDFHLPLYCVYCAKLFKSANDILQHKKCTVSHHLKTDSPKTPYNIQQGNQPVLISFEDQDSPIFQDSQQQKEVLKYIFNLATSTPMQRDQEANDMFEKSKNFITPEDKSFQINSKNNNNNNKSIIKKPGASKCDDSSKRRVTFGETPILIDISDKSLRKEDESKSNKTSKDGSNLLKFETPDMPISQSRLGSNEQFYSAKSQIRETDIAPEQSNISKIKDMISEGFTPVSIPTVPKGFPTKVDIYNVEDSAIESKEGSNHSRELFVKVEDISPDLLRDESQCDNIKSTAVSEDFYTPVAEKSSLQFYSTNAKFAESKNSSTDDLVSITKSSNAELALFGFTPISDSNITNMTSGVNIHKTINETDGTHPSDLQSTKELISEQKLADSKIEQLSKENDTSDILSKSTDYKIIVEKDLEIPSLDENENKENICNNKQINVNEVSKILQSSMAESDISPKLLSPINKCEEFNTSIPTNEISAFKKYSISPCKKVNVVPPTPVVKKEDLHLKLNFPGHLTSTPMLSNGLIKIKQTRIMGKISTKVMTFETPFKTPQGEILRRSQDSLLPSNVTTLNDCSDPGPSNIQQKFELKNGETETIQQVSINQHRDEDSTESVSLGSLTKSSIWSSVSRIVKNALGLTNRSQDEISNSSNIGFSKSFKRQLSNPELAQEFIEAPRLKRFKFTDIKCRRPIRDVPELEAPLRVRQTYSRSIATIEIAQCVNTVYERPKVVICCNKATQTDDYLMDGWHPDIF